jgi:hypothetical protein
MCVPRGLQMSYIEAHDGVLHVHDSVFWSGVPPEPQVLGRLLGLVMCGVGVRMVSRVCAGLPPACHVKGAALRLTHT